MKGTRITVVSQRGELIATQIPPQQPDQAGPRSRLVAGPGQRLHELEIEDAEGYHRRGAAAELHKIVKRRLKLR